MNMKIRKDLKICILACLIFVVNNMYMVCLASDSTEASFDKIDAYVQSEMKASHIPGLSLGIVKGSEIVYLRGYGKADPTRRPVTPQTPFVIASVSKSFTALAIMQLVEVGKIVLDAPVQQYIPSFTTADREASKAITIRHLLNQTSGLSTYSGNLINVKNGNKTLEQLVQDLCSARPASPVGKAFHYSNANYVLLADIVQQVSGESYDEYIRNHIFKPLEMTNSGVDMTSALKKDLATGFQPWFGFPVAARMYDLVSCLNKTSSAEDMTHYLIALMNGGVYKNQSICFAASIKEMQQPAAKMKDKVFYGMGFEINQSKTNILIKHPGDTPSFNANIAILPEDRWGIILMENINWLGMQGETNPIITGVEDILAGKAPASSASSPIKIYILFDIIYIISMVFILRSYIMLGNWRRRICKDARNRLFRRFIPIAVSDFMIPVSMLKLIPGFFSANWRIGLLNAPDFTLMMIGIPLLLIILGFIKTAAILFQISSADSQN